MPAQRNLLYQASLPSPPTSWERKIHDSKEVRDTLSEMYVAIYGRENLIHVPLRYVDIKVFEKMKNLGQQNHLLCLLCGLFHLLY